VVYDNLEQFNTKNIKQRNMNIIDNLMNYKLKIKDKNLMINNVNMVKAKSID